MGSGRRKDPRDNKPCCYKLQPLTREAYLKKDKFFLILYCSYLLVEIHAQLRKGTEPAEIAARTSRGPQSQSRKRLQAAWLRGGMF